MDVLWRSFEDKLAFLGIGEGDVVYFSSDIKVLLYKLASEYGVTSKADRNHALHQMVGCLQNVIGKKGTLLFPVFSWAFCKGQGFDIKTTKGEVGSFSNWVLGNREDFVRTKHPMYSFMVWGKDADLLSGMHNQDAWGDCSPFRYLLDRKAKQMFFNIEAYQGMTFCHYVEQCVRVPYRHPKYFFGRYTDENGNTEIRAYSMYVRDVNVAMECGVQNDYLAREGVAVQTDWQDNLLTLVDLAKSYPILRDDMLHNNGGNTLRFHGYGLDWGQGLSVPYEVSGIPVLE